MLQRLLKQTLKLFLIFSILSSPSFAEGEDSVDIAEESAAELQQDLDNFRDESQKAVDNLEAMLGPEDMAELQKAMDEGNQKKVQEITQRLAKKMGDKGGASLEKLTGKALEGFQAMDRTELKSQLEAKINGSLFAPIINTFPKVLDFIVNLFQDKEALPKLFSITADRKKLYIFAGINLLLMFIGWVIKRKQKEKEAGMFSGFKRWLGLFVTRLTVLILFYGRELSPGFQIFKDTFL